MFGENTEKGREKFIEELEEIHVLFKILKIEYKTKKGLAEKIGVSVRKNIEAMGVSFFQ